MLLSTDTNLDEAWSAIVHEINRGAIDKKHPFRFVSLATIADNKPAVRYVVLRQVDQDLNCYIYTDRRSEKVPELELNSAASLLMYHPKKRVQLRLDGEISLHHQNELSKHHWQKVQGDGQKAYNSILPPGRNITDRASAYEWHEPSDDRYFTVLVFKAHKIEALQLNGLEHLRASFQLQGSNIKKSWLVP